MDLCTLNTIGGIFTGITLTLVGIGFVAIVSDDTEHSNGNPRPPTGPPPNTSSRSRVEAVDPVAVIGSPPSFVLPTARIDVLKAGTDRRVGVNVPPPPAAYRKHCPGCSCGRDKE